MKFKFLLLVAIAGPILAAPDPESKGAVEAAKRFTRALQAQEFEVLADLAPDAWVKKRGGERR